MFNHCDDMTYFIHEKVNLDPNVRNIQELKAWPEFHNAVAAGLRLAPLQVYCYCLKMIMYMYLSDARHLHFAQ